MRKAGHMAGAICLLALFAAGPAFAGGRLGGGDESLISIGRVLAAFVICLLVALLAAFALRHRVAAPRSHSFFKRMAVRHSAIEVIEARRVSQYADVCLIRHDDRQYLLLLQTGASRILSAKPSATEADADE
jgi:hypothetical protein